MHNQATEGSDIEVEKDVRAMVYRLVTMVLRSRETRMGNLGQSS